MSVRASSDAEFELEVSTLIIGAGAGGMVAALSASDAGQDCLVLERDAMPAGSTALSAGLIPAAGTRFQKAADIADTSDVFFQDIMQKAKGRPDRTLAKEMATLSAKAIEWLADEHGLPFSLVFDFNYPGHSFNRMHGLPTRSGRELVDALRSCCEADNIDIICNRTVTALFARDDGVITGVEATSPDGTRELIGCDRLILACNGFGGNKQMVRRHLPYVADALYFGHDGNQGDAMHWGEELGGALNHMGAFQGHGNVAHPHGILISWAVITEGGFQVNKQGLRFWNEAQGYSEAARPVLAQPDGTAYTIFDNRIASIARQFSDYQEAERQGAIKTANTIEGLADELGISRTSLEATFASVNSGEVDSFGRQFVKQKRLEPPYHGVRVTGALFHTQGGLDVEPDGRVKRKSGGSFANLYAVGGAACGVSGDSDYGYLSGNGLLSAITLGYAAGRAVSE